MRCGWVPESDPLYVAYHDEEWGVLSHDERHLFELLVLEGAQAGLSWSTILHKREGYRRALTGFDVEQVARFGPRDVVRLLGDAGIVRNRLKVERFHQTMAREWAYGLSYRSDRQRAAALPHWLEHYNTTRPHSSIGDRPRSAAFTTSLASRTLLAG